MEAERYFPPMSRVRWAAVVVALLVSTSVVILLLHDSGPSVPSDKNGSLSFSRDKVHAGSQVTLRLDHAIDEGAIDDLFFTRWQDDEWGETHLLVRGTWSELAGESLTTIQVQTGRLTRSWGLLVPGEVPAGTYLVCLMARDCGVLTVE